VPPPAKVSLDFRRSVLASRPMRIVIVCTVAALAACSKPVDEPTSDFKPAQAAPAPPAPTKLEMEDKVVGSGREAKSGDTVHVRYTGTLMNGHKFDSTDDHGGEPFKFTLGKGEVIKGWDEGVVGMKVQGKRTLRIPPSLGYGEKGSPPNIPGNSGLVFDVELMSID
jgi:FKBP-type peptidyl-prolyl cis-trans isomerase FkpA